MKSVTDKSTNSLPREPAAKSRLLPVASHPHQQSLAEKVRTNHAPANIFVRLSL